MAEQSQSVHGTPGLVAEAGAAGQAQIPAALMGEAAAVVMYLERADDHLARSAVERKTGNWVVPEGLR